MKRKGYTKVPNALFTDHALTVGARFVCAYLMSNKADWGNLTRFVPCNGCKVAKYPPCPLLIPCCRCKQKCNSRQPCPKRESR